MIDRRALWISTVLVCAMAAAGFWRLNLLPDWHHVPAAGPDNSHTVPAFVMFVEPLVLLVVMGMLFARKWLRSGPEEAVRPWRLYNGAALLFAAGLGTLGQAFILARTLGALHSINPLTVSHIFFAAAGLFMMATGNILPKMPWLTARFRPLDPWQWNRHLRFAGKLTVAIGLFFAVGMPLIPIRLAGRVTICVMLAMLAASFWHRAKVRRESSLQP